MEPQRPKARDRPNQRLAQLRRTRKTGGGHDLYCGRNCKGRAVPAVSAGAAQLILLAFVLSHEMDLAFEDMHDQS